jgi:hypothetical protein
MAIANIVNVNFWNRRHGREPLSPNVIVQSTGIMVVHHNRRERRFSL